MASHLGDFDFVSRESYEDSDTDTICFGKIAVINHEKRNGFVSATSSIPDRFRNRRLFFRWLPRNNGLFQDLSEGQCVQCTIDKDCISERPSLTAMTIIEGDVAGQDLPIAKSQYKPPSDSTDRARSISQGRFPQRARSQSRERRERGPLVAIDIDVNKPPKPPPKSSSRLSGFIYAVKNIDTDKAFGFIESDTLLPEGYNSESQVRFFFRDVKPSSLQPQKGDRVEFVLKDRDKPKVHASRVYVQNYATERSSSDIEQVLKNLMAKVTTIIDGAKSDCDSLSQSDMLVDIFGGIEVWKCIGNSRSLNDKSIAILMELIGNLKEICRGFKTNFVSIIQALTETFLFSVAGSMKEFIAERVSSNDQSMLENVRQFMITVAECVPEKISNVASLIKPMVSNSKASVDFFLFRVLKLVLKTHDSESESRDWDDLPMVPSTKEILHGPSEGAYNLQPIKPTGAYGSAEVYLDTYFRLLRADCFSSLNKGIRALVQGNLDHRDMNAYHSLKLYGIHLDEHDIPITLALQLSPFRTVRNWTKSRNLMFGNLVCISVIGSFRDAIWATVVSRDLLQDKNIILLELCSDCNTISDAHAIQTLGQLDSRSVMVESPSYYRAYQPVLRSLQTMLPEEVPFKEEIIDGAKTLEPPNFLAVETTINASVVYKNAQTMVMEDFLSPRAAEFYSIFDQSQERAFQSCLRNRVAIIQGPPGTGKTFIGIKLVEALDSLSTKPKTPILILTYKNHALDEFMKVLNRLYPHKIARIGGRQQDPELANCNLSELRKVRKSQSLFSAIMDQRSDIDAARKDVQTAFKKTRTQRSFTVETFIAHANSDQLQSLILGCDWSQAKLPSLLRKQDETEFQVVTNRKRGPKGPLVNIQEVKDVLSSINCHIKEFLCLPPDASTELRDSLFEMIIKALEMWLPNQAAFERVRDTFNVSFSGDLSKFASETPKDATKADDDEYEEDTKAEEDERMAAMGNAKGTKVKIENIIRLDIKTDNPGKWAPSILHIPPENQSSVFTTYLMNRSKLWSLNERERILFVQNILHEESIESSKEFTEELMKYKTLFKGKAELENLHNINILGNMKAVGMTITGASINSDLIRQLKPEIVLVEEAAEVLESQLLSCLGPWVQHLILIGDHKQLRPNVESFELRKDFHLDISLMERLINNGLTFSTLALQNRMRPEFAEMLKDIYPDLSNNLKRVGGNSKPASAVKSMYFWTHASHENSPDAATKGKEAANTGRSFSNAEEANRCINLALFFISQGHKPSDITILGAYLGQVHLLRRKMREAKQEHGDIFKTGEFLSTDSPPTDNNVTIQTIDNYQGDENEIVIISLVRSNENGKTGFLHSLNRRCVAQSRAKCGMYFIGDDQTIGTSTHWYPVLKSMREQGLVGATLPLCCPKHGSTTVMAKDADDIPLNPYCKVSCDFLMPCLKHLCKSPCQPEHSHNRCRKLIAFTFDCGHPGKRQCFEDVGTKKCVQKVEFLFPCLHKGIKFCCEDRGKILCKTSVTFEFPCSHKATKLCHEDEKRMLCGETVSFDFKCGHTGQKKCYEKMDSKVCKADVSFMFSCNHPGKKVCGEKESLYKCQQQVAFRLPCGHMGKKLCYQSGKDVECRERCTKLYAKCRHPCSGKCSEPCNEEACKECARIRQAEAERQRQAEEQTRKRIIAEVDKEIAILKSRPQTVSKVVLDKDGDTAAEYYEVLDMVMKYIQPMHNWYPEVTKIEKMQNNALLMKFLQCKQNLFDPSQCQKKFHGTSATATLSIIEEGFRMPAPNNQMYGAGIYFATDSSKSAQEMYTKGSGMLLLCEVLLGRPYTAKAARKDMTASKLKDLRCDSVFAPRGSAVRNDEFIVYQPDQALPKYVIHYRKSTVSVGFKPTLGAAAASARFQVHSITPKRTFDPKDNLQMHYRIVESQFHRLRQKYSSRTLPEIKSIDYYVNPPLVAKYEAMQSTFERTYGKCSKSETVLAFHGTDAQNIQSIVKNNFDLAKIQRTAHGFGIYFSEFPDVSFGYGNGLLLCCVLAGNSHVGSASRIPPSCNSIAVSPDTDGRAQMLVIDRPDQILPCYVIHF